MTPYPFRPSTQQPFQFQPTLDGSVHNVVITWCLFGRRFYINVYTLGNVLVVSQAVVGSPLDYDISLVGGYFSSVLVYRQPSNQFEVSP